MPRQCQIGRLRAPLYAPMVILMTDDRPNRIRELRHAKNITAAELAQAVGVAQPTVSRLEKGERQLTMGMAGRIARALGVGISDLLDNSIDALRASNEDARQELAHVAARSAGRQLVPKDHTLIREFDVMATAGPGGAIPILNGNGEAAVVGEWIVPRAFLPDEHRNAEIIIIRVVGDSMSPTIRPNDRVMVDTTNDWLGPDGAYLIWTEAGAVIKRLQLLPEREPKVRCSSDNPRYDPYILPMSEVRVLGRIIGRWDWW